MRIATVAVIAVALAVATAEVRPSAASQSGPSVFIAVQEQLGLKLEPSKPPRETLIIDRLDRPTEN